MQPFTSSWMRRGGRESNGLTTLILWTKKARHKPNLLVQYHPTWVSKKAEILIIVYNHGTVFYCREEETSHHLAHRSLIIM